MNYQVTCPHCNKTFELGSYASKEIENQVLADYFDTFMQQKKVLEQERFRLEKLRKKENNE